MTRRVFVLSCLTMACSAPPIDPPLKRPPDFQSQAAAAGPALFVRGTLEGELLDVEVFGKELGSIIGYAFRVSLDGLEPQEGTVLSADEALGPASSGQVLYLKKTAQQSLLFAGARLGTKAEERIIDTETRLAHFSLRASAAAGQLTLVDTSVRRLNGEGVKLNVSGGKIGSAP